VEGRLALRIAEVAVERRPGQVAARIGIGEQRPGVLGVGRIVWRTDVVGVQRPVVVVAEDLRLQPCSLQLAPTITVSRARERVIASRSGEWAIRCADESVIDAPRPSMRW
jgi:hypothetical protein